MRYLSFAIGLVLAVSLGSAVGVPVLAQDGEVVEPLELSQPLIVNYNLAPAGPPVIESLSDGRRIFRLDAAGQVSGALEGTISGTVTQAQTPGYEPITNTFVIETEDGRVEGYLTGTYHPQLDDNLDGISELVLHGQVLSVTGKYADLFLAQVFVRSEVNVSGGMGTEEVGEMTIAPSP